MRMDGAAPTYGGATGKPARKGASSVGTVWAVLAAVGFVVVGTAAIVGLTLMTAKAGGPSSPPATSSPSPTVSVAPTASATPEALPLPADAMQPAGEFLAGYVAADPVRREKVQATASTALAQRLLTSAAAPTTLEGSMAGRQSPAGGTVSQRLGRGTTVTLTLAMDGTSPSGWRVTDVREE